MKTKILDADALGALSTGDVTAWLRGNGWLLGDTVPDRYFSFTKVVTGDRFDVQVPHGPSLRDYKRRMADLLDVLEVVENKSQGVLYRDIRQSQLDVVRLRVVSDATRNGRIPVEQAGTFFAQARDLMLSAACATLEKRSVFGNRKPKEAMEYVRALKFGPSEVGSYVATIESQVPPALQLSLKEIEPSLPYGRRVMLTLATALQATATAVGVAAATNEIAPFQAAVPSGLNANLCDAVAGMLESFESSALDIGVGWASSWPSKVGPVRIQFSQREAGVLREAARIMRQQEPQSDFELEGIIIKLESQDPSAGGRIVVACSVEGKTRKVGIDVDPKAYAVALAAHGQEKQIAVVGELSQRGRGLWLQQVRDLRIHEE